MRKTLIALLLLVPALALAQEKYTNDDLDIPPKRDAYTNADLERLPPLPVQAVPVAAAEAMPPVRRDLVAEDLEARKADLAYDRDMIVAEFEVSPEEAAGLPQLPEGWYAKATVL